MEEIILLSALYLNMFRASERARARHSTHLADRSRPLHPERITVCAENDCPAPCRMRKAETEVLQYQRVVNGSGTQCWTICRFSIFVFALSCGFAFPLSVLNARAQNTHRVNAWAIHDTVDRATSIWNAFAITVRHEYSSPAEQREICKNDRIHDFVFPRL